jgi:DNA ligase 1
MIPLLLLSDYSDYSGQACKGWMAQPKHDGVRALLHDGQLWSRSGRLLPAPAWFLADLPSECLDCELVHPGGLTQAANCARSANGPWADARLIAFDAPLVAGPYSTRLDHVRAVCAGRVAAIASLGTIARQGQIAALVAATPSGCDGIALRDPSAPYEAGRSSSALKAKPWQEVERPCVSWAAGYAILLWSPGRTIRLASADPIESGALVSVRYSGETDTGLPRCPAIAAVRDYEPAAPRGRGRPRSADPLERRTIALRGSEWAALERMASSRGCSLAAALRSLLPA